MRLVAPSVVSWQWLPVVNGPMECKFVAIPVANAKNHPLSREAFRERADSAYRGD